MRQMYNFSGSGSEDRRETDEPGAAAGKALLFPARQGSGLAPVPEEPRMSCHACLCAVPESGVWAPRVRSHVLGVGCVMMGSRRAMVENTGPADVQDYCPAISSWGPRVGFLICEVNVTVTLHLPWNLGSRPLFTWKAVREAICLKTEAFLPIRNNVH